MKVQAESSVEARRRALSFAVSAACAGLPSAYVQTASAQSEADEQAAAQQQANQRAIEEVVVTATKRAESLQDVPMAITAFPNEEIVAQGFKQLDDYAGQIPGLSFGRREPGGTNVIMRGCAVSGVAFSDNPTTSVYLDEQPITVAGFNPDPRLVDIERVEALSGPQGTLFGDASQCGTLRILTNKPDTTSTDGWVDLSTTAMEESDDLGYEGNVMFNMPIIEDKLAIRVVGFYAQEQGYIDNVLGLSPGGTFDNAGFTEDDINENTVKGGRLGVRWLPTDSWTVDFQGIYQKTDTDGFGDTDLAERDYTGRNLDDWEQLRFNDEDWSEEWYQLALTGEGSLGFADLMVTGAYFDRETKYNADSTAYMQGFQQIGDYIRAYYNSYATIYDWGGDPRGYASDHGHTNRWTFESRLSTPADLDSKWAGIVGVFYNKSKEDPTIFRGNVEGQGDNCGPAYAAQPGCSGAFAYLSYLHYYYLGSFERASDNWWHGVYESELTQKALFGEVSYSFTENFTMTLGGRFFDVESDRNLIQTNSVNAPGAQNPACGDRDQFALDGIPQRGVRNCTANNSSDSDEDDFVPKINGTYFFNDDKMVYATYSEGFRRGGSNVGRRQSVFGANGEFNTFDSDKVKNYEIGTKASWFGNTLQTNITVYHMKWDDIQVETNDPDPLLFTLGIVNFPEAEINGMEADFSWVPGDNWDIAGNVGYNNAELSEDAVLFPGTPGEKVATDGTDLPLVPDWKGSLSVRYAFDRQLFNGAPFVRAVYEYTGDSVNSLSGIQSINFDNEVRDQDSYSILNFRAGLEADRWTATLFVDNLTDEYAEQFYSDRWNLSRAAVNRPRTWGLNFRTYFGGGN